MRSDQRPIAVLCLFLSAALAWGTWIILTASDLEETIDTHEGFTTQSYSTIKRVLPPKDGLQQRQRSPGLSEKLVGEEGSTPIYPKK